LLKVITTSFASGTISMSESIRSTFPFRSTVTRGYRLGGCFPEQWQ